LMSVGRDQNLNVFERVSGPIAFSSNMSVAHTLWRMRHTQIRSE